MPSTFDDIILLLCFDSRTFFSFDFNFDEMPKDSMQVKSLNALRFNSKVSRNVEE